jgi:hypothetical protein
MQRHALLFTVRPGSEEAVAAVLEGYRRPPTEIDAETRLLGTTVLMHRNVVVRTMEIEGSIRKVAGHLARQPEIQAAERALNPYLEQPRDMSDPLSALGFFQRAAMKLVIHRGRRSSRPGSRSSAMPCCTRCAQAPARRPSRSSSLVAIRRRRRGGPGC